MEFINNTIYDKYPFHVKMNRVENALIADQDEAMKYIQENGYCRVAVIPTLRGFTDITMGKDRKNEGVYHLNGGWNPMDRVIFRPNEKEIPSYGIYSDYLSAITVAKNMLQRVGDLCIVRYKGEKDRLYLDPDPYTRVFTKGGWWDTFTLMSSDKVGVVDGGRYLAHITDFWLDKNGHIILRAEPFFQLDLDELIDAYIYYQKKRFVVDGDFSNGDSLYGRSEKLNFYESSKIPFEDFESDPMNQEIQEKIRAALTTITYKERNLQSLRKAAEENPKVAKKMANCGGLREYAMVVEESYYNLRYQGLVPEAEWLGEKALLIIEHYEKKKAEEKAARKAAKELRKRNS